MKDPDWLDRKIRELMREQAINSATLAEKRARDRQFGKMIKDHLSDKKNRKG